MNSQSHRYALNSHDSSCFRRHVRRREEEDSFLDQFDDVVRNATRGDLHAVEAIDAALGARFKDVARSVLGDAGEASDLVNAFFHDLLDGNVGCFRRSRERAFPWLERVFSGKVYRWHRRRERQARKSHV
jgi:DNA-directed RNA polymerase specialized sigma24 family protein